MRFDASIYVKCLLYNLECNKHSIRKQTSLVENFLFLTLIQWVSLMGYQSNLRAFERQDRRVNVVTLVEGKGCVNKTTALVNDPWAGSASPDQECCIHSNGRVMGMGTGHLRKKQEGRKHIARKY